MLVWTREQTITLQPLSDTSKVNQLQTYKKQFMFLHFALPRNVEKTDCISKASVFIHSSLGPILKPTSFPLRKAFRLCLRKNEAPFAAPAFQL